MFCVLCLLLGACAQMAEPTAFIAPRSITHTPTMPAGTSLPTATNPPTNTLPPQSTKISATASPLPSITPAPAPTSTPPLTPASSPAASTCTNALKFLSDLNYIDGSKANPGMVLEKKWLVQNNGTCLWTADYRIKLIEGFLPLGAENQQPLPTTQPSGQATISITFTMPAETGNYTTAWQAYSPDGELFGDPIYMVIEVGP